MRAACAPPILEVAHDPERPCPPPTCPAPCAKIMISAIKASAGRSQQFDAFLVWEKAGDQPDPNYEQPQLLSKSLYSALMTSFRYYSGKLHSAILLLEASQPGIYLAVPYYSLLKFIG